MSDFEDFEAFDDPSIRLPYKGKVYEFEPPDAQLALWINASRAGAKTPLDDMSDEDQMRRLLGPAYDEMLKDRVSSKFFLRVQQTVMTDMLAGREAAALVYRSGVSPEAVAAELAAREAESKTSSSTESAGKTQSRASTSGTTSRKGPQDHKPKKRASRSPKSSSSGGSSKLTGESSTTTG